MCHLEDATAKSLCQTGELGGRWHPEEVRDIVSRSKQGPVRGLRGDLGEGWMRHLRSLAV